MVEGQGRDGSVLFFCFPLKIFKFFLSVIHKNTVSLSSKTTN